MKKKIFGIVLVISVLTFNIITVNADENPGENFEHEATRISSPTVRCKYTLGNEQDLWLINYEGTINYNFTYTGRPCYGSEEFEANTCPDFIDVFNPYAQGSGGGQNCVVRFEGTALHGRNPYYLEEGPLNVCVYNVADVNNTNFILFHDGTNWVAEFVTGPYVGQTININDSFSDNNTHQCPSRLWISMNNQSNNLYDENPNENADWEELGEDVDSEDFNKEVACEDIIDINDPGSVGWIIYTILNYIKIIGPILVVLLSSIDFIKAVVGFDEKAMKEAQSKLVIRLVAAIGLFLVPTLVQLLLSFINATTCAI